MSVTVDAVSGEIYSGTASLSFTTFTVGSSANALVFAVSFGGTPTEPAALSVTWNSVAMTLISGANGGYSGGVEQWIGIFGLLAPTTGNHTLSASWTGARQTNGALISFDGVNQSSFAAAFPHGTSTSGSSGSATSFTLTGTSATGNYTVCGAGNDMGTLGLQSLSATGSTNVFIDNNGDPDVAISYSPGASSVTWTCTNDIALGDYVGVFTDVAASAAAAPVLLTSKRMFVRR